MLFPEDSYFIAPTPSNTHGRAIPASLLANGVASNMGGFPYISERAFRDFEDCVPHLFRDGLALLSWLDATLDSNLTAPSLEITRVIRGLVLTAGVCAPPDLWLMYYLLAAHSRLESLTFLLGGGAVDPTSYSKAHGLNLLELTADLEFLYCRGILTVEEQGTAFILSPDPVAHHLVSYAAEHMGDSTSAAGRVMQLSHSLLREADIKQDIAVSKFLMLPECLNTDASDMTGCIAGPLEIEIGSRLVPLVLALHHVGLAPSLAREGVPLTRTAPTVTPQMAAILALAGLVGQDGCTTPLATRVFGRGVGPFGIIHSYYPYLEARGAWHTHRNNREKNGSHVARSENVIYSQEGNRKTFQMANRALDAFCAHQGFRYSVFIEHAMGMGEAICQRWERDKAAGRDEAVRYVGADLETTNFKHIRAAQRAGRLPSEMILIGGTDIGQPNALFSALPSHGVSSHGAVMIIGNGFHEIKNQTDESIITVFRAYAEAGIILIFTEESALSSNDLRATGWNTYHAGFRYVHALSGQGLRPVYDVAGMPLSWRTCAERGGYTILDDLTTATRGVYPCARAENPPISVTYFCTPATLVNKSLGDSL